jgi:hypothetical protein
MKSITNSQLVFLRENADNIVTVQYGFDKGLSSNDITEDFTISINGDELDIAFNTYKEGCCRDQDEYGTIDIDEGFLQLSAKKIEEMAYEKKLYYEKHQKELLAKEKAAKEEKDRNYELNLLKQLKAKYGTNI